MHMADALISAPVAVVGGAISVSLILVAANKVKKEGDSISPAMMGVLGAFVFAAQMINFTIPGTGSSGHIIGGILLAAMLGPWAAFLTLCSVLIVQCLVFADGGLLALGCNILNMGVFSCLVAYPLIYRPLTRGHQSSGRIMAASILASIVGLELGAVAVSLETVFSGVTQLPFSKFVLFMLPIHLAIGLCEGVATGLVLVFVGKRDPALLSSHAQSRAGKSGKSAVMIAFAAVALILAITFAWIASENPDGLEWSILQVAGTTELTPAHAPATAFMADYESHLSGIVGALIVLSVLWGAMVILFRNRRRTRA